MPESSGQLSSGFIFFLANLFLLVVMTGCGGGGASSPVPATSSTSTASSSPLSSVVNSSFSSSSLSSSTSLTSSISSVSLSLSSASEVSSPAAVSSLGQIQVAGQVTYDFVPHAADGRGLDYAATERRPVRGARVELLDKDGLAIAQTVTADDGHYAFAVAANSLVRVRVKAELIKTTSPVWNFKVTDNTSGNALYVLDGALVTTGASDSVRDLHASSGWDPTLERYASLRAAAPFAILDDVYLAVTRLSAAGNTRDLEPMELRWSTKNLPAEGDYAHGEIGTSFFDGNNMYILGDEDNDTDEYDPHVLLHEFSHYIEETLSRSDNMGGDHSAGDILDIRVSMSEGFANAFSAMILNNPNYADSKGSKQGADFVLHVEQANPIAKGYYSEASISTIFYRYYQSNTNKTAQDFTPIFKVLSSPGYYENAALASIFLFYSQLKIILPDQDVLFKTLMQEQDIYGEDEYALNETNDAELPESLPIYTPISPNNVDANVCSASEFGKFNKLANAQFLKLVITQAGNYSITATKSGGDAVIAKPEIILRKQGVNIEYAQNINDDQVSAHHSLLPGVYIIELYDLNNRDDSNQDTIFTCFNVRVASN